MTCDRYKINKLALSFNIIFGFIASIFNLFFVNKTRLMIIDRIPMRIVILCIAAVLVYLYFRYKAKKNSQNLHDKPTILYLFGYNVSRTCIFSGLLTTVLYFSINIYYFLTLNQFLGLAILTGVILLGTAVLSGLFFGAINGILFIAIIKFAVLRDRT